MATLSSQASAPFTAPVSPALTDGVLGSSPDVPHVHVGLKHHITRVIRRRRRRASGTQLAAIVAMANRFHLEDRGRARSKDMVDRITRLSRAALSTSALIYIETGSPRARSDARAGLAKLTRAGLHVRQRALKKTAAERLPARWKGKIARALLTLDYASLDRLHNRAAAPTLHAAGLDGWLRKTLGEALPTTEVSRSALQEMVCLALRTESDDRARPVHALVAALSEAQRRIDLVERAWMGVIDMIDQRVQRGEQVRVFVAGMVGRQSDRDLAVLANDVVPDRWRAGPAPRDALVRIIDEMKHLTEVWAKRHAGVVETLQYQLAVTTAERMQHSSFGPGEALVTPVDHAARILVPAY